MERGESSYFAPHPVQDERAQGNDETAAPVPPAAAPLDEAPPTPTTENPPSARPPPATAARNVKFRSLDRQQSAIRVRRLKTRGPSLSGIKENGTQAGLSQDNPLPVVVQPLSLVPEDGSQQAGQQQQVAVVPVDPHRGGLHRFLGRRRHPVAANPPKGGDADDCYDSRIVDILDVIGTSMSPPHPQDVS